jgi:hypothetical protein
MQPIMRRLHPRGAANRGICVDAEGAMLGPDCVLVRRTSRGFRSIERDHAGALQKCVLVEGRDRDLLFRQSQRIAEALDKGEIALAQIYGLRIPVIDLDDRQLTRISQIGLARAYNPDEPRVPKGDPHGGEWTTGGASDASTGSDTGGAESIDSGDDGSGGGDDGASDSAEGSGPPATGENPSSSAEATAASGDQSDGGGTPSADNKPSIEFKWPDEVPPPSAPPAQPSGTDSGPTTLGSPDLGEGTANVSQPDDSQSSSQASDAAPTGSGLGDTPPPDIPPIQPSTTQQINALLRSLATRLSIAQAVLGAAYEFDPEMAIVLAAIEATLWLADYAPKIFSYLDAPKTLAELQNAATPPASPGYEIHHIVEAQYRNSGPNSNSQRFGALLESRENLVRVPYWKHVEISAWYSRSNRDYGGLTPREYLRGKSWEEQYNVGIGILQDYGVLK